MFAVDDDHAVPQVGDLAGRFLRGGKMAQVVSSCCSSGCWWLFRWAALRGDAQNVAVFGGAGA